MEYQLAVKKTILKFIVQYNEFKDMKKNHLFNSYCDYCCELTEYYKNNKFNNHNKNLDIIINIRKTIISTEHTHTTPEHFLTCGLDFSDNTLIEYFNNLLV